MKVMYTNRPIGCSNFIKANLSKPSWHGQVCLYFKQSHFYTVHVFHLPLAWHCMVFIVTILPVNLTPYQPREIPWSCSCCPLLCAFDNHWSFGWSCVLAPPFISTKYSRQLTRQVPLSQWYLSFCCDVAATSSPQNVSQSVTTTAS